MIFPIQGENRWDSQSSTKGVYLKLPWSGTGVNYIFCSMIVSSQKYQIMSGELIKYDHWTTVKESVIVTQNDIKQYFCK